MRAYRFRDNLESLKPPGANGDDAVRLKYSIDGAAQVLEPGSYKFPSGVPRRDRSKSLKAKVLSRVFSEDYEREKRKLLDPRGQTIQRWNKIFLVACLISLFVDPLFFFLPIARDENCIDLVVTLEVILTVVRSLADIFYIVQIFIRFRTAYVAPSSRVFGRGELVIDSSKIAWRYLGKGFWIDLIAALPLPQVYMFSKTQSALVD